MYTGGARHGDYESTFSNMGQGRGVSQYGARTGRYPSPFPLVLPLHIAIDTLGWMLTSVEHSEKNQHHTHRHTYHTYRHTIHTHKHKYLEAFPDPSRCLCLSYLLPQPALFGGASVHHHSLPVRYPERAPHRLVIWRGGGHKERKPQQQCP